MTMPDPNQALPDFSDVQGGSSSTAPKAQPQEQTYTVKKGDSLSKIAMALYGSAGKWKVIYEANKDSIKNPDLIYPGQVFRIPQA
jgi:nucleoid-associated protein YgaU